MSSETPPICVPPVCAPSEEAPTEQEPADAARVEPAPPPRPARGLRAAGGRFTQVWYRDAYVFRRLWRTNLFPPIIEPFLFLLAFGLGVGYYITDVNGVDYLDFVAPGVIVTTSILQATFECTYAAYFRLAFQSTFDAIIATPVNPEEVAFGEACWGASRALINAIAVVTVLALFGRVPLVWIPVILALQFFFGVSFGALSLIITSRVHQTEYFNFYLSGIIFPAQMLTGAFFPLERIPEFMQPIAWAIPLTSMIDVTRDIMLGRLSWTAVPELAYIAATTILFLEIALRSMRRRLIG
jgi:lipooligosaccharide transport system permease protein